MIDKNMNSTCVQRESVLPLHKYQSNSIMESKSLHTAWQAGTTRKEISVEEDKNDSGVASGSDFHSSSPGSDNSQDQPYHRTPQPHTGRFYSAPMIPQSYGVNPYRHNPLTPPNSEPLVSPKSDKEDSDMDSTLTPCASPNRDKGEENQDHLRRLEMSLEKCGLFPLKSNEAPIDDISNRMDEMEENDPSLKVPKINSHGKVKLYKCKQCDHVSSTQYDQWEHNKIHIKKEKMLSCPTCPFITEYKHHLEYHLLKHAGSKPFQCTKCEYSCINKSMLNSHMKSHSNVYRYSCNDCSYATKYCHSLKTHLRRYGHKPNVILDEDGNPCPDIIIDVHGTRRGPRIKTQPKMEETRPLPEGLPFGLNLLNGSPFPAYPFFAGFPNPQLFQQLIAGQTRVSFNESTPSTSGSAEPDPDPNILDLRKPGCSSSGDQQKNRRKGPAFKIDLSSAKESEEDDDDTSTTMFSNVEAVVQQQDEDKNEETKSDEESNVADKNNNQENTCQYCNMTFGDVVMYNLHMGHHGFNNTFTCNMCGAQCTDKISFYLHIVHASHPL
jgi:hunchback-like protein